jgi:hypothetical protein
MARRIPKTPKNRIVGSKIVTINGRKYERVLHSTKGWRQFRVL